METAGVKPTIASYNALLDCLWAGGQRMEALRVVQRGVEEGVYVQPALDRLDLHDLSWGAALAMLTVWLTRIEQRLTRDNGKALGLPKAFVIVTGWGKHSRIKGLSDVKAAVVGALASMGSPFTEGVGNPGLFQASRHEVLSWWETMGTAAAAAASGGAGDLETAAAASASGASGDDQTSARGGGAAAAAAAQEVVTPDEVCVTAC